MYIYLFKCKQMMTVKQYYYSVAESKSNFWGRNTKVCGAAVTVRVKVTSKSASPGLFVGGRRTSVLTINWIFPLIKITGTPSSVMFSRKQNAVQK